MKDAVLTFGVFTDCHYARRTVTAERFYPQAPDKLSQCMEQLHRAGASFLINLGDTVDTVQDPAAARQRFREAADLWRSFPGPVYLLLGNHDVLELSKREIAQAVGGFFPGDVGDRKEKGKGYYTFAQSGIRFFCLDSCYDRSGRSYEAEDFDWREEYLDACQLHWLEESLGGMEEERAVVCCHANLDRRPLKDGSEDPHILKNADQVRAILEQSGRRIAVLQGHCHTGGFTVQKGIPYITFRAMTLGNFPESNAFGLVKMTAHSITVRGYGQQEECQAAF